MTRLVSVCCRALVVATGLLLAATTAQAAAAVQSLGLLPQVADGAVLPWVGAVSADGAPLPPLLVFAGLVHADQTPQQPSTTLASGAYLTIVSSTGQLMAQQRFASGQYQGFALARLAKLASNMTSANKQAQATQTQSTLVLLAADGVWALTAPLAAPELPGAAGLTALFQCPHVYAAIDADYFAPLPLVIDANADGLDDFFLPGGQAHCLALQQSDGTFVLQSLQQQVAVTLLTPPFERAQLSFELPAPPVVVDLNGDGRTDLLLGNSAAVGYFLQQSDGRFHPVAQPLPLPVPLAGSERQVRQFKQLSRYQFERFADINQDGVPDLLLRQKQYGQDLADSVAYLKIWYGALAGGVLPQTAATDAQVAGNVAGNVTVTGNVTENVAGSAATKPQALQLSFAGAPAPLNLPGELVSLQFADFNGDHRLDASLLSAELGASSLMSALMGHGVALDIRLYPQQANGQFGDKAVASHETRYTVDVGNANFGVLFHVGHFNADAAADLLFINNKQQLQLVPGSGRGWLNSKPLRLPTELPSRLQWISVLDIEQDGIAELLLRHPAPNGQLALQVVRFTAP